MNILLSDLGVFNALMTDLKTFMITSGGWNLAESGAQMQGLTGKNLTFRTLPIAHTVNGLMLHGRAQDVNIVDPATIRQTVHNAFYPPAVTEKPATRGAASKPKPAEKTAPIPPPSTVTVDVHNGGNTPHLATQVSQALIPAGYKAGAVGNASQQSEPAQSPAPVFYGTGAAANAAKIARYFGVTATASTSLAAGHVEVLLGTTSTTVPAGLGSSAASSPATSPATGASASPSATHTSAADNGQAGGAVTVKAGAKYGIPCVN